MSLTGLVANIPGPQNLLLETPSAPEGLKVICNEARSISNIVARCGVVSHLEADYLKRFKPDAKLRAEVLVSTHHRAASASAPVSSKLRPDFDILGVA
jgi:hypothetical protein